jgi:hypothetical protein
MAVCDAAKMAVYAQTSDLSDILGESAIDACQIGRCATSLQSAIE